MMDSVNSGVANVFSNQKKLEAETRALQSSTAKFAKQTAQWLQMIDNFNTALKVSRFIEEGALKNHQLFSAKQEVGDIENWGKSIEKDMKELAFTIDYLQRQSAVSAANTNST